MTLTRQEIFNIVSTHLLEQDDKSAETDEKGLFRCKYRGPNGLKCAIGILIPDEEYNPEWEGKCVNTQNLSEGMPIAAACGISRADVDFARSLQHVHDLFDVCDWRNQLKLFRSSWNLVWPENLNDNTNDSQLQTRI